MRRRPPRSHRTDTRFPYTTLSDLNESTVNTGLNVFRVQVVDKLLTSLIADIGVIHKVNDDDLNVFLGPENTGLVQLRSEEHTSELKSLMRISYAVFCLKQKKSNHKQHKQTPSHTKTQNNTT